MKNEKIYDDLIFKHITLNISSDAVFLIGLSNEIVYVNEATVHALGYSKQELLTMTMQKIDPTFPTNIIELISKNKKENLSLLQESYFHTKNGSSYPVELKVNTLGKNHEELIWLSARNISKRKKTEELLKESEAKFRIITESSADAIFITDQDGNYVYVNQAASDLLGYPKETLIQMNIRDITPKDLVEVEVKKFQELIKKGKLFTESLLQNKEGEIVPVDLNTVILPNGLVYGSCRNISARKHNEELLKKQLNSLTKPPNNPEEIELEELLDLNVIQHLQDEFAKATGVASIITKPDGSPLTQPSNFCHLCNHIIRNTKEGLSNCLKSDSVIGRYNPEGPTIQPCLSGGLWDAGAAISIGGRHIANWLIGQVRGESQSDEDMRNYARKIGANEEELIEAFHEVPVMSLKKFESISQVLFTLANLLSDISYKNIQQARYISDKKKNEKEKDILRNQLFQSQKMDSIGRLVGGIAHDFNNMLGVIIGYSEMALSETESDSTVSSHISEILGAAKRSAQLTKQLLTFARKQNLSKKVIDLNQAIHEILKLLKRLIGEQNELVWEPGIDIPHILIDPSQVDQILTNLCINSKDSIQDSGKIIVKTSSFHMDKDFISLKNWGKVGDYVLLTVTDSGKGMDKKTMENLFEPFYTTKEKYKGTGLGLATVYGSIKQIGGFIDVISHIGEGTTFQLYLPASQATEKVSNDSKVSSNKTIDNKKKNYTVLIVEDENVNLLLMEKVLKMHQYTVVTASKPKIALELLSNTKIDLVISDIIMPEMNGFDFIKLAKKINPHIKTLFISGYTESVININKLEDLYLPKPFSNKDLIDHVNKALQL